MSVQINNRAFKYSIVVSKYKIKFLTFLNSLTINTIFKTVFLLSFCFSILSVQDFQGIATCKTKDKIENELDSTQAGGMQEEIAAMLQKQF
tara:strand:+ start:781 stop:1053 length:273 start_codon:yes stop_codon:yes gene_type:complete